MTIVQYLLIATTVISSILLLILILLQKTKADGLGLAFGSGVGEALFGSRAGNILSKLTIIFACVFLGSTLLLTIVFAGGRGRPLMGRGQGVMGGAMPAQAQQQAAPVDSQGQPVPAAQAGGAPTLPGTYLGDQPQPAAAPAEAPAPETAPAPAPAETPAQ